MTPQQQADAWNNTSNSSIVIHNHVCRSVGRAYVDRLGEAVVFIAGHGAIKLDTLQEVQK